MVDMTISLLCLAYFIIIQNHSKLSYSMFFFVGLDLFSFDETSHRDPTEFNAIGRFIHLMGLVGVVGLWLISLISTVWHVHHRSCG